HAREVRVPNMIGHFPTVRRATVLIDPTNERHISGSIVPTATIDVQTRAGETSSRRQLADAAVNVVTGAVAALSRENVKVTIDGASFNVPSDDALAGADALERRQQCE